MCPQAQGVPGLEDTVGCDPIVGGLQFLNCSLSWIVYLIMFRMKSTFGHKGLQMSLVRISFIVIFEK